MRSEGDDWAWLSLLGQHRRRAHADFDARDFGRRKVSVIAAERPFLDHRGQMHVR